VDPGYYLVRGALVDSTAALSVSMRTGNKGINIIVVRLECLRLKKYNAEIKYLLKD
jgi:hypothetical protein